MPTTIHGWKCKHCGNEQWARAKPPKKGVFVYLAITCKKCGWPMKGSGKAFKKYSLVELL